MRSILTEVLDAPAQRELALGGMQVIQRDKFRNERVFPLESLRQAARVAVVYGVPAHGTRPCSCRCQSFYEAAIFSLMYRKRRH